MSVSPATAQDSRVPPVEQMKMMLDGSKDQWVQFRAFNGRQLVYFTPFVTFKCGLKEVRYSLNTDALDETWPLTECNPQVPFNVGPDDKIYLDLALGSAKTVSVQLVYADDSESPVHRFGPCDVEGDTTCGTPVEAAAEFIPEPEPAPVQADAAPSKPRTGLGVGESLK